MLLMSFCCKREGAASLGAARGGMNAGERCTCNTEPRGRRPGRRYRRPSERRRGRPGGGGGRGNDLRGTRLAHARLPDNRHRVRLVPRMDRVLPGRAAHRRRSIILHLGLPLVRRAQRTDRVVRCKSKRQARRVRVALFPRNSGSPCRKRHHHPRGASPEQRGAHDRPGS